MPLLPRAAAAVSRHGASLVKTSSEISRKASAGRFFLSLKCAPLLCWRIHNATSPFWTQAFAISIPL